MNLLPIVLVTATVAAAATPDNLDFRQGDLKQWQGTGFSLGSPGGIWRVTSRDPGPTGKALLHRTLILPENATEIHFQAACMRPAGTVAGASLDVYLEASGRTFVPRLVRQGKDWVDAPTLLPPLAGQFREYVWKVEKFAGRRVRIALVDQDDRQGCHLLCTGFTLVVRDQAKAKQFAQDLQRITTKHDLPKLLRYDTRHFVALSNADAAFTEYRLYNCETIYPLFFNHFRRHGFQLTEPREKLMAAIFHNQAGIEGYLGQKLSTSVTGLYHLPTNRLVVYDYGRNRAFLAQKDRIESEARLGSSDLERERRRVAFGRWVRDRRDDTNISTIMHEVAHQLSFNTGMLNRKGDVPLWLAEGLAVYCESTINGAWQGIGEANPHRARALVGPAEGKGEFHSLRGLVSSDDWLRKARSVEPILLGYSQSWALFRMLMEEHPAQLRMYLKSIYTRRTAEHRLADFASAFGTDLKKLERRYQAYMAGIARREAR